MGRIKRITDKYFNRFSRIMIPLLIFSVSILFISKASEGFSDFFNRYISAFIRMILSYITGWLPFSLGETIFLCLPLIFIVIMIIFIKNYSNENVSSVRFLITVFSCISLLFSLHILSFGVAYNCTPLDRKLGIEARAVSAEELKYTSSYFLDNLEELIDDIEFSSKGSSVMPYSFSELNEKLNDAYEIASEKYDFIPALRSNVKQISVSNLMTYTHISGIYSYYTGEANINFNYPDYTFPFTMAHEMAHQRGVAPEDEASFVAFLVCMESDDSYIRYSAYINLFEYLISAYSETDPSGYNDLLYDADIRIKREIIAYNEFFEPYSDSVASEISNAINDTYLKASGESAGTKSYGLVVDLACAYFHE